jgi:hypothetical protein
VGSCHSEGALVFLVTYLYFLTELGISFLIGMFSVWLFWIRLNLCDEERSPQPNQSKILVKKGIASATLTCFLVEFLLTIISVVIKNN